MMLKISVREPTLQLFANYPNYCKMDDKAVELIQQ